MLPQTPKSQPPQLKNQWHFIHWRSVRGIMTGYGSCTYMVMMGCTHRIRFLLPENNIQRRIKDSMSVLGPYMHRSFSTSVHRFNLSMMKKVYWNKLEEINSQCIEQLLHLFWLQSNNNQNLYEKLNISIVQTHVVSIISILIRFVLWPFVKA